MYVCTYICIYVCTYVRMYMYIYTNICTCIYIGLGLTRGQHTDGGSEQSKVLTETEEKGVDTVRCVRYTT